MKAFKIILVIALVLGGIYFASSWYLANNLDRIVKEAVEDAGGRQMGTEVGLDSVSIKLTEASASLSGLRVANPAGFSNAPVFTLGNIKVDIDVGSLTGEVLVIEEITITDPQVNFEMNAEGVSNLDALDEQIRKASGGATQGNDKLLIIDRLDFKGGSIRATAALKPEWELVFDFPVVFMTDLGAPNGATADQIAAEVTAVLVERSMTAAKRAGVQQVVDSQLEKVEEKAKEKLDEKLKDLLNRD
jgi:hypothetical protein